MDELRRDATGGRWVLVRPSSKPPSESECPYCPGAEGLAGPEIAAYRGEASLPNGPGWTVRVVAEHDPYFRTEWELVREGLGLFDVIAPRGASELVIESPHHGDTLATMDPGHLESVLWMYRDRIVDLKRDDQIRDILISRHHRKPGVAPHHPYSRVSAIPIVFDATRRELREAREYYEYKRRCIYCDILRQELASQERVVRRSRAFIALVPYAARTPLETWILPRRHGCSFEEALDPEVVGDLAALLSGLFRALSAGLGDPSYELVLHNAPNLRSRVMKGDWATIQDDYHWHIEVMTHLERINRVGGIYVNEMPPETAAAAVREAWEAAEPQG